MKKLISLLLTLCLVMSFVACGGQTANTDNVSGVKVSDEVLEALGMSAEEFAALDPEKQQALADQVGAVASESTKKEDKKEDKKENKTYTPADVNGPGEYKVVMGDYMNTITLYYKDGKLVKLVEEFQKSDEEELGTYTVEGDALAEYTFNFIDWDGATLQEILDGMKDYGSFGQYEIYKE